MPTTHHKLDSNDSDATAVSLDTERIKDSDVSPTQSQFPEFPNAMDPTAESQDNNPPPIQKEGTVDPCTYPLVIPPKHSNRTLVLCFDGTGDQFDADNSNVVRLVSLLKKDDSTKQMVYYQVSSHFSIVSNFSFC